MINLEKRLTIPPTLLIDVLRPCAYYEYLGPSSEIKGFRIPPHNPLSFLSRTKLILYFSGVPGAGYYDLTTNNVTQLPYLEKAVYIQPVVSEFIDLEQSTKFYVTTLNEVNRYQTKVIKINRRNPSKFKISKEELPLLERRPFKITRVTEKWLIIVKEGQIVNLYYRKSRANALLPRKESPEESYDLKRYEGNANYCIVGKNNVIFTTGYTYKVLTLKENGTIEMKHLDIELPVEFVTRPASRCLDSGVICLFNLDDYTKNIIVIEIFNDEGQVIHSQTIRYENEFLKVVPISKRGNESYFAVISSETVDIWVKREEEFDYQLQIKMLIAVEIRTNFLPYPPSIESKKKIINQLKDLIPLPVDLISSTVDFF